METVKSTLELERDAVEAARSIVKALQNEYPHISPINSSSIKNGTWWVWAIIAAAEKMGMEAADLCGETGVDVVGAVIQTIDFDRIRMISSPEDPTWDRVGRIAQSALLDDQSRGEQS